MPKTYNIQRFFDAQNKAMGFNLAKHELSQGKKQSHWIWYIFPQLSGPGFGNSSYGLENFEEACVYLSMKILANRYLELLTIIQNYLEKDKKNTILKLMGSDIDALKLVSSLTLFREAAIKANMQEIVNSCEKILDGKLCMLTLKYFEDNGIPQHPLKAKYVNTDVAVDLPAGNVPPAKLQIPPKPNFFSSPPPIDPNSTDKSTDAALKAKLNGYIKERETEWTYHYNFLGLVAFCYWLSDTFSNTDYLHNKSKEVKISAAKALIAIIDGSNFSLSAAETHALTHDRLGTIVQDNGGLTKILASHPPTNIPPQQY